MPTVEAPRRCVASLSYFTKKPFWMPACLQAAGGKKGTRAVEKHSTVSTS